MIPCNIGASILIFNDFLNLVRRFLMQISPTCRPNNRRDCSNLHRETPQATNIQTGQRKRTANRSSGDGASDGITL